MNNNKDSKAFYIVLSLLISVGLWFYVVNEVNTEAKDTIRNIPVTVVGQEELLEKGMVITGQNVFDLDLKIEGNRKSLMKLTRDTISVIVDASGVTVPGEYEVRCSISLPSNISASSVTIKNRDQRVKLKVENYITKAVEVKGNFTGSLAADYRAEEFVLSPAMIEVSGPSGIVETIDCAAVTLAETGLNESFSGMLPVELWDKNGNKVTDAMVKTSEDEVHALYPVAMWKELNLKADVIPGGGADAEHVTCKITPETILVSGPGEKLGDLTELILGRIDLAQINNNERMTFPISVPDFLKNESGITEATVMVSVAGLVTKSVEISRVELVNCPEEYEAKQLSDSVRVTVRGTQAGVEKVTAGQIRAIADLSEFRTAGIYKAEIQLQMDAVDNAGVLNEGKTVSVELTTVDVGE